MVDVNVKLLDPTATAPQFAHSNDACADVRANEDITILPHEVVLVPTGFALAIPEGYEGLVRPRSGLSLKHKLLVVNTPGTIDAGYRGEIKIVLMNLGNTSYTMRKGDRIAQLAIRPVPQINFIEVDELDSTKRGAGGFGSTGKH